MKPQTSQTKMLSTFSKRTKNLNFTNALKDKNPKNPMLGTWDTPFRDLLEGEWFKSTQNVVRILKYFLPYRCEDKPHVPLYG